MLSAHNQQQQMQPPASSAVVQEVKQQIVYLLLLLTDMCVLTGFYGLSSWLILRGGSCSLS